MLGAKIDTLYELRAMRLSLEKQTEELKKQEKDLEFECMLELNTLGIQAAKGNKASFSYSKDIQPTVTDWDGIYTFIKDSNDFTVLHKRLSSTVWKEYNEDGLLIPGTSIVELNKVSLRKL